MGKILYQVCLGFKGHMAKEKPDLVYGTLMSKIFRAKKKLDHLLEGLLPGVYLPLYTMVTFTRIPYAEAAHRARLQDRIVYGSLAFLVLIIALVIVRVIA